MSSHNTGDKLVEDSAASGSLHPQPTATTQQFQTSTATVGHAVSQYQTLSKTLNFPVAAPGAVPQTQGTSSTFSASHPAGIKPAGMEAHKAMVTSTAGIPFSSTPQSVSALNSHPTMSVPQGSIVQIGSTSTQQPVPVSVSSILRASSSQSHTGSFPTHLPRGAVAAASALAGPKSSMTAVPMIRPSHTPTALQNPGTTHGSVGQRSSLITPVLKSTTPPASTRSPSPVVSIAATQAVDMQSRPSITVQSSGTSTTMGSIQITLQAPRTTGDTGTKPILTHQHAKQINVPQLNAATSAKVLNSPAGINPIVQQGLVANMSKSGKVKGPMTTPSVTSATASTLSLSSSTTTTAAPSIPIAKVPPVRQQQPLSIAPHSAAPGVGTTTSHDNSRLESSHGPHLAQSHSTPLSQPSSTIFLTQAHRSVPLTTSSISVPSVTSNAGHSDIRHDGLQGLPQMRYPLSCFLPPTDYSLMYHQQMSNMQPMQQVLNAIATPPIRPGIIPNQNPNLTASLQTATPGSTVQFNQLNQGQMVVTMDALRQQALSVHTPFTSSSISSSSESIPRPITPSSDSLASLSSVALAASTTSIPLPALTAMGLSNTSISTTNYSGSTMPQSAPLTPQHSTSQSSNTPVSTPNASPRPSILRKRTNEGPVKKPVCGLNTMDHHSPRPDSRTDSAPQSNTSSPKTPATPAGESQSSTDTALSSEATTPTQNSAGDLKIKQEPPDAIENGFTNAISSSLTSLSNSLPNSTEASPRKKPRKQLLNANEELKDTISSDDDDEDKLAVDIKEENDIKSELRDEYIDDEGVRWTIEKCRPNLSLMNFYNISWKPKNNHFQRYTDVKAKDERRPTVNELSNQRSIMQKASGWKLFHMAAQLEDLNELEKTLLSKLSTVQSSIAPRVATKQSMITMEDDIGMLHELTQANIQRCKLIMDQLEESRTNMLKVLDHRQKIYEIINKHMSKRPIKKKERS